MAMLLRFAQTKDTFTINMIYKAKEWVFHYEAFNKKTGEVRDFNIGTQTCRVPHLTKRWKQLESLSSKLKKEGSSWVIKSYGVKPLKEYSYDPI